MTRPFRIALIAAGSIVLLLLIAVVAGVITVRSQWFRDQVRGRIVSQVELASGGRVEIASLDFDWRTLTAIVRGFTLHGTEPPNGPPLLHADEIAVGLKIISILKQDVDIALLRVDKPDAFILVAADGTTNIPNPKTPRTSNKPPVETILDLAVQHFEVNRGAAQVLSSNSGTMTRSPYSAKADGLRLLFTYDSAVPRYHGSISLQPLDVAYGHYKLLPTSIRATIAVEKNSVVVEQSEIMIGDSEIKINGKLSDFNNPVVTAEYGGKLSVAQAGSMLKLASRQSGVIEASGSVTYRSASDFKISGLVKAVDVNYQARGVSLRHVRAQAKIDADPRVISSSNIDVSARGGEILAKAEVQELRDFKIGGELQHFNVAQVAALVSQKALPYDGLINGPFSAVGRVSDIGLGRLTATARLTIAPAGRGIPVHGLIDAKYTGASEVLDLGQSFLALPNTRLEFAGVLGKQLRIHFASSNLNDLLPALQSGVGTGNPHGPAPSSTPVNMPVTMTPEGELVFDGAVTGPLENPAVTGHLNGTRFVLQNQTIDALNLDIAANKNSAEITNGAARQKSVSASFSATVGLHNWNPETNDRVAGHLALQNANLKDILALAGNASVPAAGMLNASASFTGTVGNPQASSDLTLTKGNLVGEPFDLLTAHLVAVDRATQTVSAQLSAGSKQVKVNATYRHGASEFLPGSVTYEVMTNAIELNQIVTVRNREPDLAGTATVTASGAFEVIRDAKGNASIRVNKVNADATVSGLQLTGKRLGDLHLTAATVARRGPGPLVEVKLRSNLASADITADGSWSLEGDYPGSAKLEFKNLNLDTLRRLALTQAQADSIQVGGSIEGTLDVTGPAAKPADIEASLVIPKLEVHPLPNAVGAPAGIDLNVRNSEPIRATLKGGTLYVESARLIAQNSDLAIRGRATLTPRQDLDLRADGHVNLAIVHLLAPDVAASGQVLLNVGVRGNLSDPQVNGTLSLEKANLALVDVPNGLSNANGVIQFTGNQATIQSLTAESGGGKVSLGGFADLAGGLLSFRVNANATGVRIRYPTGVSTVADAELNLVGTSQRSILQGTVTVDRLAFNPKTDLGSLLSSASSPPETPSASTGFASNLQFDIEIETSPDITFESTLTQSVEADASLRLRGTIQNPVLLGRVNITQGDLAFFGNKYTINQGSISFFNPVKLEPILNIDLETVAKGVDVTITVSGPISKLNVSYRSDPPLQFADIVALLATGRVPNDATIAARQSTAPQQSWQQMGASALVGQVIANPVSGRLQRFFGVSQLKIDPTISGVTGNPQAKVTLQQQVTPDITFTYITDVANSQEQVIRVEWAFSPAWSAVAVRDENGEFGVDFLYKKRFK